MPRFTGEVIGEAVSKGVKSVSLPPTVQIGFDALENLVTLRVMLQTGQENAYAIGNTVINIMLPKTNSFSFSSILGSFQSILGSLILLLI